MSGPSTADLDTWLEGVDYPVFVVTVHHGGRSDGCLVGFATQASINPPRLLVCLSTANRTYELARQAETLAVHLLDAGHRDLAELFGGTTGDQIDKFSRCRWEPGPQGLPLLSDSAGWMIGTVLTQVPLGDHVGFLLAPVQISNRPRTDTRRVLTYQQARTIAPGHPA
ncbi:flavin reductase family protein [Glaciibacter sp. 2TAF33]|uniref:flavin reductase family protein n=1 Tax=Glaciibacter sp. 2TAF33 TaxID=3233015 RepID=UPI003F8E1564